MMHAPAGDEPLDIPAFRARIARYSDAHLLRCGRAAAYMASPAASYGPARVTFIQQLEELRRSGGDGRIRPCAILDSLRCVELVLFLRAGERGSNAQGTGRPMLVL